jgi:hypothetical protein
MVQLDSGVAADKPVATNDCKGTAFRSVGKG